MVAAAIDLDTLNNLFDNQKKLDDAFDLMFNEDLLISSSVSLNDKAYGNTQKKKHYSEELSFDPEGDFFVQNERSAIGFVIPVVLEIAVIYYGIMLFF